jgi:hypothetical protein
VSPFDTIDPSELPPLPEMNGVQDALARNQQMAAQRPHGFLGGLRNVLGNIGDALLVANGADPIYRPRKEQAAQAQMLGNYLGRIDPAFAQMLASGMNPQTAVTAYKIVHPEAVAAPEEIRLMQAAGIDPTSEEGRAIIRNKLTGAGPNEPNFVRELEALGIDPHSKQALELYYGRNSPAGYLLKPPAGGVATPSAGPTPGTIEDGYRFKGGDPAQQENWEPVEGGATASTPSPTFR